MHSFAGNTGPRSHIHVLNKNYFKYIAQLLSTSRRMNNIIMATNFDLQFLTKLFMGGIHERFHSKLSL